MRNFPDAPLPKNPSTQCRGPGLIYIYFFTKVHWDRVLMVEISCRVVEDKIELEKKKKVKL